MTRPAGPSCERILRRPRAVAEIAEGLPVSRPAASQHLRVLKEARLVSHRAEGTRRIYAVDVAGLVALRADLDRFWTEALSAFKAAVESTEKPVKTENKEKKEKP